MSLSFYIIVQKAHDILMSLLARYNDSYVTNQSARMDFVIA